MVLLFSCTGDTTDQARLQKARLHGRWVLREGYRNDKPTETLQDVYFDFDSSGLMQTNLPVGAEAKVPFIIKDTFLTQEVSDQVKNRYTISQWTDTSLVLRLDYHSTLLRMHLIKQ